MKRLGILVLLALGGCNAPAGLPQRGDTPQIAACRREARDSQGVRQADRQINVNNQDNMDRVRREVATAEQNAFNACLRREGLPLPGGVEQIQRRGAGL